MVEFHSDHRLLTRSNNPALPPPGAESWIQQSRIGSPCGRANQAANLPYSVCNCPEGGVPCVEVRLGKNALGGYFSQGHSIPEQDNPLAPTRSEPSSDRRLLRPLRSAKWAEAHGLAFRQIVSHKPRLFRRLWHGCLKSVRPINRRVFQL